MTRVSSAWGRPRAACVAGLLAAIAGPSGGKAQAPSLEFEITPRVLVSAFGFGDRELGTRIAGLTRTELARRYAHRDLWVVSFRETVEGLMEPGPDPPRFVWELGDFYELEKQLPITVIVEVNATTRADGRLHLEPQAIRRNQAAVPFPAFDAADVTRASHHVADVIARVPDLQRVHPTAGVCSAKVFSDFQVDRQARFIADARAVVRPDRSQGYLAPAQFVVDTTGRVMPESLRLWGFEVDSTLVRDARRTFTTWRFAPAEVGACKVRQLVQTGISR